MGKITKSYIIKVKFAVPVEGKREHFFGSLAAIYEKFTPFQIGCKLPTLWKAGIEPGNPKNTRKCTISNMRYCAKDNRKKERSKEYGRNSRQLN